MRFDREDSPDTKLGKLTQALEPVSMSDPQTLPLFAGLLSIPLPDDHPPLALTPQKQKEKTMEVLVAWLLELAAKQPVRVEFEDLHWADPSSLEVLGYLIEKTRDARILVLLTFRPEFVVPWPAEAHFLSLQLSRLSADGIVKVIEQVAGKPLPAEVVNQLVAKSDGVPLYIEEMTRELLESGLLNETDARYELSSPLPRVAIPSSLQDSFASRLDRLAPVRELAQIGAVLGRDFSYTLIRAVSSMNDTRLQDGLRQLSDAGILIPRGVPGESRYTFKHALLQDVACIPSAPMGQI